MGQRGHNDKEYKMVDGIHDASMRHNGH